MEDTAAGVGARERYAQLVAARLRRLKAAGASDDELLAALDEETASERPWRVGGEGEQHVAAVLEEWRARCGFAVLHDLVIPSSGHKNIDHVVVGAHGVTVIDTKAWTGDVRITMTGVWMGRWGHRRDLDGLATQVADVRHTLVRAGLGLFPVRGVLCLANENPGCPPDELLTIGPLAVGHPETVARLAASAGGWTTATASASFAALAERYDVIGSALPPAEQLHGVTPPGERAAPMPRRRRKVAAAAAARPQRPPLSQRLIAERRSGERGGRPRRRSRLGFVVWELLPLLIALALVVAMVHSLT
jgi:hypothetical protein